MTDVTIVWHDVFKMKMSGYIDTIGRIMYIPLDKLIEETIEYDMIFSDNLAQTIAHEIIHQIITDLVGDEASKKFDNICSRKYYNPKHWFGGVGGPV